MENQVFEHVTFSSLILPDSPRELDESSFIPIEAYDKPIRDAGYLHGSLSIGVNSDTYIDKWHWDLIFFVWDFMIGGVETLLDENEAVVSYADQPYRMHLKFASDKKVISISDDPERDWRCITVGSTAFFDAMLGGGMEFFQKALPLCEVPNDQNWCRESIDRLDQLSQRI